MVGSGGGGGGGGDGRSKEAVGMMALHDALRNVCLNSDWTYSVFWTIRPRPRCRGGNGCKVGDDNGSLMLMWEDGFCRSKAADCMDVDMDGEDPVRKAFSKMSIQLYNYGEGLMGKVASDKCHKWVFKEPSDQCEPNISNYWQSSFDALPPEWTDQFACGIQTIAVIQAGHGLLQLGSCKIIPEDLHFVLRMRHMFESLGYQSGFFLSQLFSSTRTNPPPSSAALKHTTTTTNRLPPPIFNWSHPPLPPHAFNRPPMAGKEDARLFLLPPSANSHMGEIMPDHDQPDLKWPNGLSFFTALTGRSDEAKLLYGGDQGKDVSEAADNAEEYLSLESQSSKARSGKFKRSFTLPARMASSSSSSTSALDNRHSHDHAATSQGGEYRGGGGDAGIYSDIMETFLE